MKKSMGSRIVNILVAISLITAFIAIIFLGEEGPATGALIVLVILGGFILFVLLGVIIKSVFDLVRSKISKIKAARYRKKYVTTVEYKTTHHGTFTVCKDSCKNRIFFHLFDDGMCSEIYVNIENNEVLIVKALRILEALAENHSEYYKKISEYIGDADDNMMDIDGIDIYSDDGEIYAEFICDIPSDSYIVKFMFSFDNKNTPLLIYVQPEVYPI